MATIEFSQTLSDELQRYITRLQTQAVAAAQSASRYLHETVVARAQQDPQWRDVADHIEVWSEDGYLVIGVRDNEMSSQAFQLEYGDEVRPPSPLFRTLNQDIRNAGDVMREHMQSQYGPGSMSL